MFFWPRPRNLKSPRIWVTSGWRSFTYSNFYGRDSRPRQRVRNFRRAWQATENLEKYLARKFRKLPCSENRFPRQTFRSKNLIFGRPRPKTLLTAREHRRVRYFGTRSGLATQGSNFCGRDSRPRQRVRNFRRAWRATENLEKYLAQQFDFQRAFQFKKFNCWSLAPQSIFDRSGAPKGSIF